MLTDVLRVRGVCETILAHLEPPDVASLVRTSHAVHTTTPTVLSLRQCCWRTPSRTEWFGFVRRQLVEPCIQPTGATNGYTYWMTHRDSGDATDYRLCTLTVRRQENDSVDVRIMVRNSTPAILDCDGETSRCVRLDGDDAMACVMEAAQRLRRRQVDGIFPFELHRSGWAAFVDPLLHRRVLEARARMPACSALNNAVSCLVPAVSAVVLSSAMCMARLLTAGAYRHHSDALFYLQDLVLLVMRDMIQPCATVR